jgi:hypothetical protein
MLAAKIRDQKSDLLDKRAPAELPSDVRRCVSSIAGVAWEDHECRAQALVETIPDFR